MRRRSFLLPLLFVVASILRADTPIAPPRFGSSPRYPFTWQLATNGENYLLAWSSQTRTQFATLNNRGEVIDDATLNIESRVGDVIAVQRDYLVVFGPSLLTVDADTLAVTRTHAMPFAGGSMLATDGTTALLANASGYARFLDADGDSIGSDVKFAEGSTGPIGAAGADGSYLIVWIDNARLARAVIRSNGETVRTAETLVPVGPEHVAFGSRSVATNGRNFLVSWRSGTAVYVALVSPYGEVLTPPVTITEWEYTDAPQVAWNGREFVVVLEARTLEGAADIIELRVDAQGKPVGTARTVADGPQLQYHAAVASTTRSTLAVWGEFADCYAAGYGGIMARTIEPLGPIATVSRGEQARELPSAADAGATTLVAWIERGSTRGVRAALLPSGMNVEIGASTYAQGSPAVATNGDAYLVAWTDLHEGCGTSVSAVVVDRNGHAGPVHMLASNANTSTRPAVAWNGSEYVVVWEAASPAQLFGMRVAADGTPMDPHAVALTVSYPDMTYYTNHTGFPAIIWTGQEYLAIWTYSRSSYIPLYPDPPPILEIRARRLNRILLPLGTETVLATPAYGSTLGWNGSEAMAIWQGRGGLYATRMSADGHELRTNVLGPYTDPTPPSLSIAWTGYDWVVGDGRQLLRLRRDGALQSRTDLGPSVPASSVSPTVVVYQRTEDEVSEVYTRKIGRPRRRAVQ